MTEESDPPGVDELRAQVEFFEKRGWETQAEQARDKLERVESLESMSPFEKHVAEKKEANKATDDIEELQEKLEWYEERGWDSLAESTRERLSKLTD